MQTRMTALAHDIARDLKAVRTSESKWIRFEESKPNPKTKVWNVLALDGDVILGRVSWFGRWRKYCFFPSPECVFEQDCLRDIALFIEDQTKAQRKK